MSMDGMVDFGKNEGREEARVTNETEEEYAVLDRGDDYKLSIMRKKRAIIKVDDEDANEALKEQFTASPVFPKFPEFEVQSRGSETESRGSETSRDSSSMINRIGSNTITLR